jgi:hypothetical protein
VKTLERGRGWRFLFLGCSARNTRWQLRDLLITAMSWSTLERSYEWSWTSPETCVGCQVVPFVLFFLPLSWFGAGSTPTKDGNLMVLEMVERFSRLILAVAIENSLCRHLWNQVLWLLCWSIEFF